MGETAIRRKLAAARRVAAEGPGAGRAWPLAFGRAVNDALGLVIDIGAMPPGRHSLAELLDLVPDRPLVALLEGPGQATGVLALGAGVLAGLIEAMTIGRVTAAPPAPRRPTRTDAAMVGGLLDQALGGLDTALSGEGDAQWATGFRTASFLEDARPLGLILDCDDWRVMTGQVRLGNGAKSGQVLLALPAEGRAEPAARDPAAPAAPGDGDFTRDFTRDLAQALGGAEAVLTGVLGRLTLPLGSILALAPGMVLPLGQAGIDRIAVTGLDGRELAVARLGQARGQRALRVQPAPAAAPAPPLAEPPPPPRAEAPAPPPALRAAG